jgi:hypothetical protein
MPAQNAPIRAIHTASRMTLIAVQNGGSARCYQKIFVAVTAPQSWLRPNGTISPAACLFIATLEVNVLHCRDPRDHASNLCQRVVVPALAGSFRFSPRSSRCA